MKKIYFLVVTMILGMSSLFAFGINNINPDAVNNVTQVSLKLSVVELDNITFSVLAVDEKESYYILKLRPILMYYGNLPINVKDSISISGIILSNFSKIKEIIVDTINIKNETYSILNKNGYLNNRSYNPCMMNGYMMDEWYYYTDPYGYRMMNEYGYQEQLNHYNQNMPYNMNGRK
ncbi:hypothetical protein [Thermosipho globiformans]|uniref:hypothetical protein n=1 Tax=Thermosipho globiformans TaxID=380685 RepID=UPI000F8D6D48|nr:hypothetical protein [Thermosipho globiformans]